VYDDSISVTRYARMTFMHGTQVVIE
jgi:hypothetical protein